MDTEYYAATEPHMDTCLLHQLDNIWPVGGMHQFTGDYEEIVDFTLKIVKEYPDVEFT